MKRLRTWIGAIALGAVVALPLPGCARGPNPLASVAGLALSIGASVGSYFLIRELD